MWFRPYGHSNNCRCRRSNEMNKNLLWIFILITQSVYVASRPASEGSTPDSLQHNNPKPPPDEQVISVRITSSVAVGRGRVKAHKVNETEGFTKNSDMNDELMRNDDLPRNYELKRNDNLNRQDDYRNINDYKTDDELRRSDEYERNDKPKPFIEVIEPAVNETTERDVPDLSGANIEFLKQLHAKKESMDHNDDKPQADSLHFSDYEQGNENDYDTPNDDNQNDKSNEKFKENDSKAKLSQEEITDNPRDTEAKAQPSILNDALKLSEERLIFKNADDEQNKPDDLETAFTTLPDYTDSKDESQFGKENEFTLRHKENNETDDSLAEPSIKSILEILNKDNENYENIENVPLARSVLQSPSSKNYIQGYTNKPPSEREPTARLTTVSFNVVHDPPKSHNSYNAPAKPYVAPREPYQDNKFYEPQKVYSQPAQIYSEPAKFYSEPAKIYSEPAKIYSEPAKVYSEPAKIYSEPAKFYSEPASLHLNPDGSQNVDWQHSPPPLSPTTFNTTPVSKQTNPEVKDHRIPEHQAEKNYEVEEKVSVMTDGRSHGVQETTTEKCKQDNCKVGYVVKGREFNKYRVEERTSDGFIVGEYGVVRNEDGALRGVRYTADSEASPRLIYDALMKFLQLK